MKRQIRIDEEQFRDILDGKQRFIIESVNTRPEYSEGQEFVLVERTGESGISTANEIMGVITLVATLRKLHAPHLVILGIRVEQVNRALVTSDGKPLLGIDGKVILARP